MTVDDAKAAVDAGADAVVVSNHGGRVLDFTPGAATVLPGICEAVKGQITILADGGIRSGADVLKLLALGADAVMIGRPFSVAAIGGLQQGVVQYIEKIQTELAAAMVLTGVQNAKDVPKGIVY
jgi:4-hydroxymandelate oxidase